MDMFELDSTKRTFGILIVDDEAHVRSILQVALRHEGHTVWLAGDSREALDLYRRHHESIDVVLMDVRMPGRDGPQTLAALQNLNPQVRCCFMSGSLGAYTEEGLFDLGAVAIVPKPFHLDELGQVLRNALLHNHQERHVAPSSSPEHFFGIG
jgi:DNA-binding NtrC family response regulator